MVESYFEYTLSQCSERIIPAVCSLYKTKEELLEEANKGLNGNDHILGQGLLVLAAIDFISEHGYIVSSELNNDARKIHTRCERNLKKMKQENMRHIDIAREQIFNVLVDLNWLFSSKYMHVQKKQSELISLLMSPVSIRIGLKNGLRDVLYNTALYDKDRSKQYMKAQLTRYQYLHEMHPDFQVRDLFAQGYTSSDFKELQDQAYKSYTQHIALFYNLTATAAKAEQIRRMR